jgi:uncharacterized protein (TIGR00251 family)
MILRVRVTPNARSSSIIGWEDDPGTGRVLRVRVGSPAVEGKANGELRSFLAKTLGLPKSSVVLDKGGSSRIKSILIPDGTRLDNILP